jgi:uroporphyrinogen III methyltransferase/synthase
MPDETPVAMVSWGTIGRQRTIEGTLATIADIAAEAHLSPPSITVIGDVVKLRGKLGWFERLPLFGERIVVTRSKEQAPQLVEPLTERGADVLQIPSICTIPPDNLEPLKEAILGLHEYDWLVFTSANGVLRFFEYFDKGFEDARDIGGVRIAAVGPGTAATLRARHLAVDVQPKRATGADVARAMVSDGDIENLRICLLRAEVANPELPRLLQDKGAIVDDIPVYRTVAAPADASPDVESFEARGADWILFTSASTVIHFHERFPLPAILEKFPDLKLVSIGPETSKAIQTLGVESSVEAKEHTVDGLLTALEREVRRSKRSR